MNSLGGGWAGGLVVVPKLKRKKTTGFYTIINRKGKQYLYVMYRVTS